MPTANQLGLNLNQSLVANGINKPDRMKWVHDYTDGYNVISLILEQINPSRRIDGQYGNFQKGIMGLGVVSAQVASTSVISTTSVQINFSDPSYPFFRLKDNIVNNVAANVRAVVTSTGPGFVIVASQDGVTALPTSTYPNGSIVTSQWNSNPYSSNGMTPLYEVPTTVQNWTQKIRETMVINRDDLYLTWYTSKSTGKEYWALAQEAVLIDRYSRMVENSAIWGEAGFNSTTMTSYNGGLLWAIQDPDRGGIDFPLTSLWTLDNLVDFLTAIAERYNQSKVQILCACGRSFLRALQGYVSPFIQFTGKQNTFGGDKVKGIDVYMYAIAGIEVGFTILPALGSSALYGNPSTILGVNGTLADNYCFALDIGMFDSIGKSTRLPSMERVYRGEKEMLYGVIKGMVDGPVAGGANGVFNMGADNIATSQDSITLELLSDSGIDVMARRCGAFYYAL